MTISIRPTTRKEKNQLGGKSAEASIRKSREQPKFRQTSEKRVTDAKRIGGNLGGGGISAPGDLRVWGTYTSSKGK